MLKSGIDEIVETVMAVYRRRGHEAYYGEAVTQLEHAVQSAELARKGHPDDTEFILAAFLHDYGHLCDAETGEMDGYGTRDHEAVGAAVLGKLGFSEKTTRLVAGHVLAKRYLVSTDSAYFGSLSEASKVTLEMQGGMMTIEARKAFEEDTLFILHIALRKLDEQAKVSGQPAGDTGWIESLMREHLAARLS